MSNACAAIRPLDAVCQCNTASVSSFGRFWRRDLPTHCAIAKLPGYGGAVSKQPRTRKCETGKALLRMPDVMSKQGMRSGLPAWPWRKRITRSRADTPQSRQMRAEAGQPFV
jgi:hypothetical protein